MRQRGDLSAAELISCLPMTTLLWPPLHIFVFKTLMHPAQPRRWSCSPSQSNKLHTKEASLHTETTRLMTCEKAKPCVVWRYRTCAYRECPRSHYSGELFKPQHNGVTVLWSKRKDFDERCSLGTAEWVQGDNLHISRECDKKLK